MTPIDWSRLTRRPVQVEPMGTPEPIDKPTAVWAGFDTSDPGVRTQPAVVRESAPAYEPGSTHGMCRWSAPKPFSETDDEIGGSKRHDDGLGD